MRLGDDLLDHLVQDADVQIASFGFSLSAFERLEKALRNVRRIRFVFTTPTFSPQNGIQERLKTERREYYIPGLGYVESFDDRYEIRIRNRLQQRAIARQCAKWIKSGRIQFRSVTPQTQLQDVLTIQCGEENIVYLPFPGFTSGALGFEPDLPGAMISTRLGGAVALPFRQRFDAVWNGGLLADITEDIVRYMDGAYRENEPSLVWYLMLYHLFGDRLRDFDPDTMPNPNIKYKETLIWRKLFPFQRDAAIAIINKLEKFNGCILADSVGLGKTFTALAVIKYYELRNKDVLVLTPKRLEENWNSFNESHYKTNPFRADDFAYQVLCHTDLQRERGISNGIDFSKKFDWSAFDLVVIDESHNFRNDKGQYAEKETRYQTLVRKVMREHGKKVLMLSATPVNNRFKDLFNQLKLAYRGDTELIDKVLANSRRSVEKIFLDAERVFNQWSAEDGERSATAFFQSLPPDFLSLLDNVTIARSRKHIQRFYGSELSFPKRLPAESHAPPITTDPDGASVKEFYAKLDEVKFAVYTPLKYLHRSARTRYDRETATHTRRGGTLTQSGREDTIKQLMLVNVLKRLESSVHSFRKTISKLAERNRAMLLRLARLDGNAGTIAGETEDWFEDDEELVNLVRDINVSLSDIDVVSFKRDLNEDAETFERILDRLAPITPDKDAKLAQLKKTILEKAERPFNAGNRKLLVFSAFADTVDYLYDCLASDLHARHGLVSACITGRQSRFDFGDVLSRFAPIGKEVPEAERAGQEPIDIVFATDCISEGQNLQDCDCVVNYDIHWNPVRIIQRFGRVDRLRSPNAAIKMINFWPNLEMDEYLRLRRRVTDRMTIANLSGTGADNPLKDEDFAFREEHLKRMKDGEIVDMEALHSGVSITDLGLGEYALSLKTYLESHDLSRTPIGIDAILPAAADLPPGVVFFLRNRDEKLKNPENIFHPFYSVYVDLQGEVVLGATQGKEILERLRTVCPAADKPFEDLCRAFNDETNDGKDMSSYSVLLDRAIASLMTEKETADIHSLFTSATATLAPRARVKDNSFELVAFFVIREARSD